MTLSSTQPYKVDFQTSLIAKSSGGKSDNIPSALSGRPVKSVKEEKNCSRTINSVQQTFNVAGEVVSDPNALTLIFRRLNGQVLNALALVKKIPNCFSKFRAATDSFVGFVDTVQLAGDVNYFYNRKYKADNKLTVASRVALAVADVGGTLLWLQEMSFIKLSQTAKALGEVRLFSFVPKVISNTPYLRNMPNLAQKAAALGNMRVFSCLNTLSIGLVAGKALALYYLLSAVNSLKTLVKEGTPLDKKQARFDLLYNTTEFTLNTLLIIGVANTVGLGILGATCIATGLASFAHKSINKA